MLALVCAGVCVVEGWGGVGVGVGVGLGVSGAIGR